MEPDFEPDSEPITYSMHCVVCGAASPETKDFNEAQRWAFRHAGRNPMHLTYREIITRPWRAWMQNA
ncbi:hypothetical protein ACFWZB_23760 [Streptomyces alboflavus]|uniref:DUF7848 domain-containing protein n=1 Tax=Streptomyces alboflavus TaxID=67267 RepID=UPI0036A8D8B1